jgi:antitoxin (DNA-binding transcriptional repressor) of toxin-antitoxin stability system
MNYGYDGSMKVSVADAKNRLPKLIKAVESGETVTVMRHGIPVVDIVRTSVGPGGKRVLGTGRGKLKISDPDWWKPMSEKDAESFMSGLYETGTHMSDQPGK